MVGLTKAECKTLELIAYYNIPNAGVGTFDGFNLLDSTLETLEFEQLEGTNLLDNSENTVGFEQLTFEGTNLLDNAGGTAGFGQLAIDDTNLLDNRRGTVGFEDSPSKGPICLTAPWAL